ncbi:MAG: TonB-dependent receptor [Ignavibacteria bacterium]|nr:TonB-dependent receptor [Ignavibacteria bacterium]
MKKTIITFFYITFYFLIFLLPTHSQDQRQGMFQQSEPKGVIRGKILDLQTKKPMEYVSVRLFRSRDSSLVAGTLTNENGNFELTNVPFGRYYAVFKFIGFKTKIIDSVFVTPRSQEVSLSTIYFENESIQTKEVEVTATKDIVSYEIDRRIYDVSRDLANVSGTALDVLSNVPSVSVDIEGNVSLRGSGNVQILIDGKPSSLLGFDRGTVLEQIPADNIERIEIITNPSAKFDPDGVAGIINIILKKQLLLGWGAILNANAGTADKYNGSLNFNVRSDYFNTTLGYNFRSFSMRGNTTASRNSFAPDTTSLFQKQEFLRKGIFHRFQFSTEWTPNTKNSLIFNVNAGLNSRRTSDSTGYNFVNFVQELTENYYRQNSNEGKNFSYDLGVSYKLSFDKKDKELNSNIFYMSYSGNEDNLYNQTNLTTGTQSFFNKQNNKTDYVNNNLMFEINYSDPFDFGKIDVGFKTNLRYINIDYSFFNFNFDSSKWIIDNLKSNEFSYNENIFATYFTFAGKYNKFGYQIGLRGEGTFTNSEQKTLNETFLNKFFNFFPTVHLSYQILPINTLMLSYTRRINRPHSFYLNPFIDYSDPQNLSKGNPNLKPEFSNAFELSNLLLFGRNSLNLTLFYRFTSDIISRVTRLDTSKKFTITTYENINQSKSLGFEAILNYAFFNWWKNNLSFSYFYLDINGIPEYGIPARNSNSWNLKYNSVISLNDDIDLQFNLSYDSPVVTIGGGGMYWRFFQMGNVGRLDGIFTANLALKIDVFGDRGTINFRLQDVFKTITYNLTTTASNFTSNIYRIRESRVAFIGFQYKINEYKRPRMRKLEEMEMEFE